MSLLSFLFTDFPLILFIGLVVHLPGHLNCTGTSGSSFWLVCIFGYLNTTAFFCVHVYSCVACLESLRWIQFHNSGLTLCWSRDFIYVAPELNLSFDLGLTLCSPVPVTLSSVYRCARPCGIYSDTQCMSQAVRVWWIQI